MPEKEEARRESKKKLIRHLGRETRGRVHRRLINQPPKNPAGEPEEFHLRRSLLCRRQISIKLSAPSRVMLRREHIFRGTGSRPSHCFHGRFQRSRTCKSMSSSGSIGP